MSSKIRLKNLTIKYMDIFGG